MSKHLSPGNQSSVVVAPVLIKDQRGKMRLEDFRREIEIIKSELRGRTHSSTAEILRADRESEDR